MSSYPAPTAIVSTFNPSNYQDASSSQYDSRYLRLTGGAVSGALTAGSTLSVSGDVSVDSGVLAVDTSNNYVGVNTASPTWPLHVVGNQYVNGRLSVNTATTSYWINSGGSFALLSGHMYFAAANQYLYISGTQVLSYSGLGSTVTSSSLTSVGTLTSLSCSGNATFGSSKINFDSSNGVIGIGQAVNTNFSITASSSITVAVSKGYFVNGTSVLNSSTLGGGVINSSLQNLGTLTSLDCSGNVSVGGMLTPTYTSIPTFTSSNIGYCVTSFTSGSPGLINATVCNTTPALTIPIGVWRLDGILTIQSTSGTTTMSQVVYSLSTSATVMPTFGTTTSSLRPIIDTVSRSIVNGTWYTYPRFQVSTTFVATASTTLYLVCQAFHSGTLNGVTSECGVIATRLA